MLLGFSAIFGKSSPHETRTTENRDGFPCDLPRPPPPGSVNPGRTGTSSAETTSSYSKRSTTARDHEKSAKVDEKIPDYILAHPFQCEADGKYCSGVDQKNLSQGTEKENDLPLKADSTDNVSTATYSRSNHRSTSSAVDSVVAGADVDPIESVADGAENRRRCNLGRKLSTQLENTIKKHNSGFPRPMIRVIDDQDLPKNQCNSL